MRVSRWLDNSPTGYWNQPIIYQKKRELALYHWCEQREQQSPPCRSLLCAEGQQNRGPKEPIARNTHIFAT